MELVAIWDIECFGKFRIGIAIDGRYIFQILGIDL